MNDERIERARPPETDGSQALVAIVERYASAPDECTIYPRDAGEELVTAWVTAQDGSFVSLDELR